jgi:hypothetical protein
MAQGGTITFTVEVKGYWQRCPICEGRGAVPPDFYEQLGAGTNTSRTICRRCYGTGTVGVPAVAAPVPGAASSTGVSDPTAPGPDAPSHGRQR